jgi:Matrixin
MKERLLISTTSIAAMTRRLCSIIGVVALWASMTACAQPTELDISKYPNKFIIADAMAEWNIYLKEPLEEGVGGWKVVSGDPGEPDYGGITKSGAELVIIRPGYPEEIERRIALHELGHVIGLKHSASEKDIMFHSSPVDHVSPGDLEQCQLLGKCY